MSQTCKEFFNHWQSKRTVKNKNHRLGLANRQRLSYSGTYESKQQHPQLTIDLRGLTCRTNYIFRLTPNCSGK